MDGMDGGPLNFTQQTAFEAMREAFAGKEDPEDVRFPLDDRCLLRYLIARNFDFKKAEKMLSNTLIWRAEFGVKRIHTKEYMSKIQKENATGKIYLRGFDNEGHVIMYMRPRYENTFEHEGNVMHLVYQLERAVACMVQKYEDQQLQQTDNENAPKLQEKLCLLVDYAGYSLYNAPPMKTSNAILDILQNHFPERLYKGYCINPPWIFSGFWKLISPFIDIKTKTKVIMVTGISQPSDISDKLNTDSQGAVTVDCIEKDLGGAVGFDVNYETHGDVNIDNKNGSGEFMEGQPSFSCARYLGYKFENDTSSVLSREIDIKAKYAFSYEYSKFE